MIWQIKKSSRTKTILDNQKTIVENQETIKKNQASLDEILKNQAQILARPKK